MILLQPLFTSQMRLVFYILILLLLPKSLLAEDNIADKEYVVKIEKHVFLPAEIQVEANKKFKLVIQNNDSTIEEFESDDLKKEKLVGAKKSVSIAVGPLKAGEYKFYGDFHQKTAQGKIIVK